MCMTRCLKVDELKDILKKVACAVLRFPPTSIGKRREFMHTCKINVYLIKTPFPLKAMKAHSNPL